MNIKYTLLYLISKRPCNHRKKQCWNINFSLMCCSDHNLRSWNKRGRGVQSKIRVQLVQGTGRQGLLGCSSERTEPRELGDLPREPPPGSRMVCSNLQGSRQAKHSPAPQGKPEQDPVQNGKMEMETGQPGETEKLYLTRQGWGLQSSAGTETYSGWMKDNKGLYKYDSSESQGRYQLAAKLSG